MRLELFFRPRSRSLVVNGVQWKGAVVVGLFVSLEQQQWVDPAPLFLQSQEEIGKFRTWQKIAKQLKAGVCSRGKHLHASFPFPIRAAEVEGCTQYVQAGDLIQAYLLSYSAINSCMEGLLIPVCVVIPFLLVSTVLVISVTVCFSSAHQRCLLTPFCCFPVK